MKNVKSTCHFSVIQDKRPGNLAFHVSEPPNLGTFVLTRWKVASRFLNFGFDSPIFFRWKSMKNVKSTCHFSVIQDKLPRNLAFHISELSNLGTFVLTRRRVASRFRHFGFDSPIFVAWKCMKTVKSTCHFSAIQDKRPRNLAFHISEPPNLGTFVLTRRKVASRFHHFGCDSPILSVELYENCDIDLPLFGELGQTSQDSCVSGPRSPRSRDVCPNSLTSGKSISPMWGVAHLYFACRDSA